MACIEIGNFSFAYAAAPEKQVLRNVNLKIEQGEYVTVCGKSGSGKTTLLRHLKTVLAPAGKCSGEILLDGRPLKETDLRTQTETVGFVMQNPDSQIVTDRVWHELAFGLESLGENQKTIRLRVAEMASYFGIQNWFDRDVSELSGGQKQLLCLASVMAMHPQVLILDEPTSQLDPIAASDFLNTVKKINQELGTTIIITEHRLEEIYPASDRVVVMENGAVKYDGTPRGVAGMLHRDKNDMFYALPAPARIYYEAMSGGGTPGSAPAPDAETAASDPAWDAASDLAEAAACPLTVREGRNFLTELFRSGKPEITSLGHERLRENEPGVPAVAVKDLWFRYEKDGPDVLKGVTFNVPKGSIYAVVGGNGTGKSTMMKSLCHICVPYRGQILISGKRIEKYKAAELFRNNLAMLPQDPQSLFVKPTVREDLEEMLGVKASAALEKEEERKGFDAVPLDDRIKKVSETCEISHLLASHPYDLSGGEQQRAALAKVLLTEPKILLLDEPTKGMDSFFKMRFARILKNLKKDGVTVIMVSHDIEFCAEHADTVGMFFDGSLLTSGRPEEFFSHNGFYTTAANRMARHMFAEAVTADDVIKLIKLNGK